jgi:hypothetical protein
MLHTLFTIAFQHFVRLLISFYNRKKKDIFFISVQVRGTFYLKISMKVSFVDSFVIFNA